MKSKIKFNNQTTESVSKRDTGVNRVDNPQNYKLALPKSFVYV